MSEPVFRGVGVALVTLFDQRGEVDAAATAEHAARLVDAGVRSVVVAGSTGEAAALEPEERVLLLRAVRDRIGAIPLIAGTGAPSVRQAVRLTRDAVDAGADAVLTLSPPGVGDPRPYYEAVAEKAGEVPVLAYHFPAMARPGIGVPMLAELPIAGCKDSSGDPERLLETLEAWDGHLYSGSSAILPLAGLLGCTGAILALANAEAERCIAAFEGDATAARELARPHIDAHEAFPQGIKLLTARRYGTSPAARLG